MSLRDAKSAQKLDGRTALVTGASRGIGRAIAFALAQAGCHVVVHYVTYEAHADTLVRQIHASGHRATKVCVDLRSADGPQALAERARAILGARLDILVANAGIGTTATIEETTVEEFDDLFAVNVRAPFFLVKHLLPLLSAGSSIILMSSLAATTAGVNIYAYAATKGAVDTLVKHFAAALGPRGIRVNAVAPGLVDTDMCSLTRTAQGREAVLGMQALKRICRPDDIAPVVAFLASEDARWITGEIIRVDGGARL